MKPFKYKKKKNERNPEPKTSKVFVRVKRNWRLQIDDESTYSLAHQNQCWSWFPSCSNLVFFSEPPTSFSLRASPRLFQKLSVSTITNISRSFSFSCTQKIKINQRVLLYIPTTSLWSSVVYVTQKAKKKKVNFFLKKSTLFAKS